jgi:hypothetical protein
MEMEMTIAITLRTTYRLYPAGLPAKTKTMPMKVDTLRHVFTGIRHGPNPVCTFGVFPVVLERKVFVRRNQRMRRPTDPTDRKQ